MKRAQVSPQVFIFIFAMIVVALVLFWGTKVILDLKDRAEFADLTSTITKIEEKATTYFYLEAGSEEESTFRVPSEVKCICFRNIAQPYTQTTDVISCDNDRGDLDKVLQASGAKYNLFIAPPTAYSLSRFKIMDNFPDKFQPNIDPLCIKIEKGILKFKLTSKGTHVEIAPAT